MRDVLAVCIILIWISKTSCRLSDDEDFIQLVETVERLAQRNTELEEEVEAVKSQCGTRDRRFLFDGEPPVAFTATIHPLVEDHMNPHQGIVFETMVTDIGGGYDNQTGVFTAPYSGIYIFTCSLLDHWARLDGTGVKLHAEIVQNGHVLARVFSHSASSYRDQGAQTVFADVTQGDKVWVRIFDSTDAQIGGQKYSTFSGYLLYPTN